MHLKNLIVAARGELPVDCLFINARIINVFSGEIISGSIAVHDGHFVGFGDYPACRTVDLKGRFVAPGLIDAHVHIESSMTSVAEFARAVLPRGTTAVVADPHEIANVMGVDGIHYMLAASENLPMNVLFSLPSCVPATAMETAGAVLDAESLRPFLSHERIVALGEMMNFPGVIGGDDYVIQKIHDARLHRKPLDGHAPGLTGKPLSAYVSSGISSDHESTNVMEAMEKLRSGMHLMIREGTGAKNLKDLLPIVNAKTAHQIMWCTDDRHPQDICDQGHIDFMIRTAIDSGIDPVTAIRIGTLNPARYFGLHRLGGIGPGRKADMVVFSDLHRFEAEQVYAAGQLVAENGRMVLDATAHEPVSVPSTMNVKPGPIDFSIPAQTENTRVMSLIPGQIVTGQQVVPALIEKGAAVSDPARDILKIAVVERHKGTGNVGKGFVSGFKLQKGALASSVAHDSHHIIVVGVTDADMITAVRRIIAMGGGLAVVCDGKILEDLPLPVAGLMAMEPLDIVRTQSDALIHAAHALGVRIPDPFMTLSFLALPVIPELKITDKGLFDVIQFKHVPLFADSK
ncbi:MAG: adenine deaminase [Desulfobacteraceae bacterium]|nr:MAG: adenine deaminase [Desulfobacteraceae bacterium]